MPETSVVIPVYNEEDRLGPFLDDLYDFSKNKDDLEIVFVNDGSTDNSLEILRDFKHKERKSRIISYQTNRGKGYAVKQGVLESQGEKVIFIDADGSIHPKEIERMAELLDKYQVVVGDRSHPQSTVIQPKKRKAVGVIFNLLVKIIFQSKVSDNLCGFKGFRKKVAKKLFENLTSKRWIFDVELFFRIKKNNYSLHFLPIKWKYRGGSKISFFDPLKMAIKLLRLRLRLLVKGV